MHITSVILAAGQGTRMNSKIPKVMHRLAGTPLIEILFGTLSQIGTPEIRVVASQELLDFPEYQSLQKKYGLSNYIQKDRDGTASALRIALAEKSNHPILVMCGDAPLVRPQTLQNMITDFSKSDAKLMCLGFKTKNPKGYGRLVSFENDLLKIVEEKDATAAEKEIKICNSGIYLFDQSIVNDVLEKISNNNAAKEYYLTDSVRIANELGHQCIFHIASETEVMGINNRSQLSEAEVEMQERLRQKHMENGATIIDPKSVFFTLDTKIGKDVVIHPNVVIGPGVTIADEVEVHSFSHIHGAEIGKGCSIGPFARIRAKTTLGENVKIGNFVETKSLKMENGAKASHLSYLGDGSVGKDSNIGAGTIFCNYDGYEKYNTQIGANAFIGSNSALVAPLEIGDGAIIGAGSVITENVSANDLAIARARQSNFHQKAELVRKKKASR